MLWFQIRENSNLIFMSKTNKPYALYISMKYWYIINIISSSPLQWIPII